MMARRPDLKTALNRKEFLKVSRVAAAAAALPLGRVKAFGGILRNTTTGDQARILGDNTISLGAAEFDAWPQTIYARDIVLDVTRAVMGEALSGNNIWYELAEGGLLHSSWVQPVRTDVNQPRRYIPAWGLLAEVTIPLVEAHLSFSHNSLKMHRLYYASTHWVSAWEISANGEIWYRIWDDLADEEYYAPAHAFRLIPNTELTALSPDVSRRRKKLVVSIGEQLLTAYEGEAPVFISRVSTGDINTNPDYVTPIGTYTTFYKRPSRYMRAADSKSFTNFPGVPWVTYFRDDGYAFHGAYWHNDFGAPRSHGCVNLPPNAARWIYRWTDPVVRPDYRMNYDYEMEGTTVVIEN